jgi:hypothetical protein
MARVTRAQFDNLPTLDQYGAQSQLEPGDVMIHNDSKQWNAYRESGPLASFHVSMMVDKANRIHALPTAGVQKSVVRNMGDMAIVFRLAPTLLNPFAGQAAQYAEKMDGIAYSKGRALAMPFASKSFDAAARKRLAKYATPAYAFRPKHVVCSELIILAYQFAFGEQHQSFINLDAKHATPGDLESYFLHNPNSWQLVGRVRGVNVH